MSSLFAVLLLVSLICLVGGLIKPQLLKRVLKKRTDRNTIALLFGGLLVLFFILTAVTSNGVSNNTKSGSVNSSSHSRPIYQPLDAWYTDPGWVGYVNVGKGYKSISGSWTVPTVSQSAADNTPDQDELMSTWIGIGGFNGDGLLQIGTNQSVVSVEGGTAAYLAFWERYPLDPATVQITEMTISPGDGISASIAQQADGSWVMQLSDLTNGQSFSKTVNFNPDQTTAEWVMENEPTNSDINGPRVLPNFGTFTFSSLNVNGHAPSGVRKIKMIRGGKTIVEPSELAADGSFTISSPQ